MLEDTLFGNLSMLVAFVAKEVVTGPAGAELRPYSA
jgi:hypothetical protein